MQQQTDPSLFESFVGFNFLTQASKELSQFEAVISQSRTIDVFQFNAITINMQWTNGQSFFIKQKGNIYSSRNKYIQFDPKNPISTMKEEITT